MRCGSGPGRDSFSTQSPTWRAGFTIDANSCRGQGRSYNALWERTRPRRLLDPVPNFARQLHH